MRIIRETVSSDISGFDDIYTPITDLTSIPGAKIGEIAVGGNVDAFAHVSTTNTFDHDTFRTALVAGEKYRLVFRPDDPTKFQGNVILWQQDSSGRDSALEMNLIGAPNTYIEGALYSEVFSVAASGTHWLNFQVGVSPAIFFMPGFSLSQMGYELTLERIGPKITEGTTGDDQLTGIAKADRMYGLEGNDVLLGRGGNDRLSGGSGNDLLDGSTGRDTLLGGGGSDTLDGGTGKDVLAGSIGADTFRFTAAPVATNADRISDFNGKVDRIALDNAVFTGVGGNGALDADAFTLGTAATTTAHRVIYDRDSGQLFYDADGQGGAAAVLIATLDAGTAVNAGDFLIL